MDGGASIINSCVSILECNHNVLSRCHADADQLDLICTAHSVVPPPLTWNADAFNNNVLLHCGGGATDALVYNILFNILSVHIKGVRHKMCKACTYVCATGHALFRGSERIWICVGAQYCSRDSTWLAERSKYTRETDTTGTLPQQSCCACMLDLSWHCAIVMHTVTLVTPVTLRA